MSRKNAFLVCSFWYVNAPRRLEEKGRGATALRTALACRNRLDRSPSMPIRLRASCGAISADLQHGRSDQFGDPTLDLLGRSLLMAQLLETMEAWLPGHVATGGRIL